MTRIRRLCFPALVPFVLLIQPLCTGQVTQGDSAAATATILSQKTGKKYIRRRRAESEQVAIHNADTFYGTQRRAAKISISDGPEQEFADVGALLDSGILTKDGQMIMHKPAISSDQTSDRVIEEQHNVIVTGFLYASAKESDNSFRCIIGTDPGQPKRLLSFVVSGLPASGPSRARLKAARDKFKKFFGDDLPAGGDTVTPPIKVRVRGSLFFDVVHRSGTVGPQGLRPRTAWEIRPVTDIEFEP